MTGFISDALLMVLLLSLIPMVGVALVAGVVGLLQAATQIQDASIGYLCKVLALIGVIVIGGQWASGEVASFFTRVIQVVGEIGRGV